jgi:hypothetical protein
MVSWLNCFSIIETSLKQSQLNEKEVKSMKRMKVLVPLLSLLMLLVVPTVMALGPSQAAEVGNNPNLFDSTLVTTALENPSDVRITWSISGKINHWMNAEPAQGIMNNVELVINSPSKMLYFAQHQGDYENKWVYWSGEYAGGTWVSPMAPGEGPHGAIYWMHRSLGYSPEESLEIALERPYGAYLRYHFVGEGQ